MAWNYWCSLLFTYPSEGKHASFVWYSTFDSQVKSIKLYYDFVNKIKIAGNSPFQLANHYRRFDKLSVLKIYQLKFINGLIHFLLSFNEPGTPKKTSTWTKNNGHPLPTKKPTPKKGNHFI